MYHKCYKSELARAWEEYTPSLKLNKQKPFIPHPVHQLTPCTLVCSPQCIILHRVYWTSQYQVSVANQRLPLILVIEVPFRLLRYVYMDLYHTKYQIKASSPNWLIKRKGGMIVRIEQQQDMCVQLYIP